MFCVSNDPQDSSITTHIESIGKVTDLLSAKYENLIFIGDFSATGFDTSVEIFCNIYSF